MRHKGRGGGGCYSTAWLRQAEAERGWGSWRALAWHVLSGEHNRQQAWCRSCGCSHLRNFELQCNRQAPGDGPTAWELARNMHISLTLTLYMLSSIGVSSWCHVSRLRLKMKDMITACEGEGCAQEVPKMQRGYAHRSGGPPVGG